MSLKIHSGWCRGMTLRSPRGSHTRPTASRTREAIWNSLAPRLHGSVIIDFFCGSGAVGIEGLSRGARHCTFVENDRSALAALRENLRQLELRAKGQIDCDWQLRAADAHVALAATPNGHYDILWLDPPYEQVASSFRRMWPDLLRAMADDGVCVLESDQRGAAAVTSFLQESDQLAYLIKQRKYGKTVVSFFEKAKDLIYDAKTE